MISDVLRLLQARLSDQYASVLRQVLMCREINLLQVYIPVCCGSSLRRHADAMEAVLGQESENGRIARLLIKLGFVNERPDVRRTCTLNFYFDSVCR